MGQFIGYMLQVSVIMTLLYLAYKWLLSSTTFFRFNRFTMLAIYVVSWSLPWLAGYHAETDSQGVALAGMPVVISYSTEAAETAESTDWFRIAIWIYIAGVAVATITALAGVWRMMRIIRSGVHTKREGYTEVVTALAPGPFSWGRYIVLRPEDCDASLPMVIEHETTHLRLRHWLDLIPAQITAILQWFSPAAWLMIKELKDCHEFETDREMACEDRAGYQMMLIRKTVGSSFPTFADSLNHSQIKKRITMMMTKRTSPLRLTAACALPAVMILAAFTISQPVVADVVDRLSATELTADNADKFNKFATDVQSEEVAMVTTDSSSATEGPKVAGKVVAITQNDNASASESTAMTEPGAKEETKKEEKPAIFVDGKLYEGSITELNPNDIKGMTIKKDDPAYPQGKIMIETVKTSSGEVVHATSEKIADFRGGYEEMKKFLTENINYPSGAEKGKLYRVIVQFTVTKEGNIEDAKIVRSQGEAFDNEAIRVTNLMSGHWIPGEVDGKPANTKFTLPINFKEE